MSRKSCRAVSLLCLFLFSGLLPAAETTLIPKLSTWKYLDDGSNQGTSWSAASFDDSAWASGAAQLGYGDGDEATVVSYGGVSSAKFITTYFRHSFNVADLSNVNSASLNLMRDDGAVIYLNGVEIARSNMPGGNVSPSTARLVTIAA